MRKLLLFLAALLLCLTYAGCTDSDEKPKSDGSSNAPAKQEEKKKDS